MSVNNVRQEDWIVGGLSLLLVIALLVFPWFDISVNVGSVTVVSATFSATGSPDGWIGVLALIAAIALIADLAVERFSPQTQIPAIGGSREQTRFVLAAIAAGFTALKFVLHIHFSYFGWGFYATVVIAAALLYFAAQARSAGTAYQVASSPRRAGDPPAPTGTSGP